MKNILYLLFFIAASYKATAQITYIPDPNFEQALIDLGIDSDGIVNGEVLTDDVLNVTTLVISPNTIPNYPYPSGNGYYEGMIYDLTGIEDFVNLEELTINITMIEELTIGSLVNLKYLDCVDNMLTSIDVSNNNLLEYLDISSGGDVIPFNGFSEIDLSNNPNIHTLIASGYMTKVILSNGNNNSNMFMNISAFVDFSEPDEIGHVCIEVDDAQAAQNNQYPYSEWTVYHAYKTYSYTDDVEVCVLNVTSFEEDKISIYPNPASDILYFESDNSVIDKIILFDLTGRKVLEQNQGNSIFIAHLQRGNYILKIFSDKGVQTEKIIIK